MAALGYAWKIGVNIFYVAVVVAVLSFVAGRPETIILPILGVLYVTIRLIGMGIAHSVYVLAASLDRIERRLNAQDVEDFREQESEFSEERTNRLNKLSWDMAIDGTGLGIITLVCLWKFFVAIDAF